MKNLKNIKQNETNRAEMLELGKKLLSNNPSKELQKLIYGLCPELAESEDERIRKIIRLALIASEDELSDFYKVHNTSRKECTDWLEKQKEQKPAEYLDKDKVYAIMKKLTSLSFCVPFGSDEEKQIDEITRDVRSLLDYPIEQKPADCIFTFDDILALESAMSLAKDDEKLYNALKSIFERVHDIYHDEQKPAENDGKELLYVCNKSYKIGYRDGKRDAQKPAEWSEEDEEMISNIISSLRGYMCLASKSPYYTNHEAHIQKEIEFLNTLPERFALQPKQEWSKEDKNRHYYLCKLLRETWDKVDKGSCIDDAITWFEELPKRISPPSWKPSEEQMDSLRDTIIQTKGYSYSTYLPELYEQLKKL